MEDRAQQLSRRSLTRTRKSSEASRRTVLIALAANGMVAIAKFAAGAMSGSTALLAEAAHSVADTTNQLFLLASLSLGKREPDAERPFGYGQERFLWTFLAAVGMFLAGAVFAVGYGVYELIRGTAGEGGFLAAYVALGIAGVAEGTSWLRALRQTRREARAAGAPLMRYLRASRDPNVKMVLFEDSVALMGVLVATFGIAMHQATGVAAWDRGASIAIGVLLVVVALTMGGDARQLLGGASARPEERRAIEEAIESFDEIDRVVELLTLVLGPNTLLVAARIDLGHGFDADRVEQLSEEVDAAIRDVVPDVTEVFLDATPGRRAGRYAAGDGAAASDERSKRTGPAPAGAGSSR